MQIIYHLGMRPCYVLGCMLPCLLQLHPLLSSGRLVLLEAKFILTYVCKICKTANVLVTNGNSAGISTTLYKLSYLYL